MSKWDDIEDIRNEIDRKAKEFADSEIAKKYGDTALSDIDHYVNVKAGMAAAGIYLGLFGIIALTIKNP